jgi:hypothetical protein
MTELSDVVLGARYRDKVSGWAGIATARYEYLNGCRRIELGGHDEHGKPDAHVFDVQQLEFIDAGVTAEEVPLPSRFTGGPRDSAPVQR